MKAYEGGLHSAARAAAGRGVMMLARVYRNLMHARRRSRVPRAMQPPWAGPTSLYKSGPACEITVGKQTYK